MLIAGGVVRSTTSTASSAGKGSSPTVTGRPAAAACRRDRSEGGIAAACSRYGVRRGAGAACPNGDRDRGIFRYVIGGEFQAARAATAASVPSSSAAARDHQDFNGSGFRRGVCAAAGEGRYYVYGSGPIFPGRTTAFRRSRRRPLDPIFVVVRHFVQGQAGIGSPACPIIIVQPQLCCRDGCQRGKARQVKPKQRPFLVGRPVADVQL